MDAALEQARQYFLDGIGHFEAGRLEPARASFEASLAQAPGRASVLANLGITLFQLRHWQDAVPVLQQAVAADPAQTDAWFALGLCHEAQAQWADAADALARGLALDPARADLWMACGQCQANAGRMEAALRAFDRVLEIDPGAAAAWSARGGLLRDLGRLDDAAPCFEQAIALGADPELHAYYLAAVRGSGSPAAPPRAYVETLFDQYSVDFQSHLVDQLQYRGHEWLLRPLIASRQRWRSVLDLGCGTGLCGPLVAPLADAIDGVDLSAAMLAQARALGVYRELIHEDLTTFLARTDRRADLVLAADVFIYVGALDAVFGAVRRLLEPGGCFAFTVELTPNSDDFRLLPSLRYAHSEAYIRRLAGAYGFNVRDLQRAPLRQSQQEPLDALYVYLDAPT
jgi:predicted TPR repeat methyltransferase